MWLRHCCRCVLASCAVLAMARGAGAQSQVARPLPVPSADSADLINPDRPGIADGSRVIQPSQLQVEIGFQQELRRAGGIRTATIFVPMLIRLGITDRIEARVESNTLTSTRASISGLPPSRTTGYSPVSIGTKYQIYDSQGDNRRSLGLIARVFPPTGSSDFRSDLYTGDVRLAADWDFVPHLSLNPNVGLARQDGGQGRAFVATLGAMTVTYSPTDRINPFVDVGAQNPEGPGGGVAVVVDAGLAYVVGRDVQVDLSAGRGVRGSTPPRPFVAIGLSLRKGVHS